MASEDNQSIELPILGRLPKGWRVLTLGEVLDGGTRNGIYKPKEFHGRGAKIINMGELFGFPRLGDIPMKRIEVSHDELAKGSVAEGDLIFARRSLIAEGAGKCSIIRKVLEPTIFESSIIRARPNKSIVVPEFLFYLFQSDYGFYILDTIKRTVAVSGITGADLVTLPIPIPPLSVQQKIADALTAIDDKIDLNEKLNESLASIFKAIFKEWFIDFGPVEAKSESRKPVGMNEETAALFPNRFEKSELGKIPEGWISSRLSDLIDLIGGGTPKTTVAEFWNGDIPWFSVTDTPKGSSVWVVDTEKKITQDAVENSSTKILPVGTTIISARGTVGNLALVGRPIAMNQSCYGIKGKGYGDYFIYLVVSNLVQQLKQNAHGSVFDTITRETFDRVTLTVPQANDLLLNKFDDLVGPLFIKIQNNVLESMYLEKIRDLLLPKLISGDIELKDLNV
jgi:type I restriction enzyme S subunit